MMTHRHRRSGTVLLEAALVYPLFVIVVLALILLVRCVLHYQQVSHISREASRWAAVHGARSASDSGTTAATAEDVYAHAILPHAIGMRPDNLTYSVTWNADNSPTRLQTVTDPVTSQSKVVAVANAVTVRVAYTWDTRLFGTVRVSSRSVSIMSY